MATEVIMPRVDMDMASGRISRWYVEEGVRVEAGQPLFEIETDKAAMEIEAPSGGILRKLPLADGAEVSVGSAVGWICAPDEMLPQNQPEAQPEKALPDEASAIPQTQGPSSEAAAKEPASDRRFVTATPLARRIAAGYGISLATVQGSGPRGRIQARDVERLGANGFDHAQGSQDPASVPILSRDSDSDRPVDRIIEPPIATPADLPHGAWLRKGEGPPVVLLHGFGADLNSWRLMLGVIAPSRSVFAIDLPGHGASPALPRPDLRSLADAVAARLAAEGLSNIDLVGHSLGGAVATELADIGTVGVRSLFLIAPAGLGPEINGAFIAGLARATSEASLAPWLRLLVDDGDVLTPSFIRSTARQREDRGIIKAQTDLAAAMFPDGTQGFSIRGAMERLDMPVRLVFGTNDRIIPPGHAMHLPPLAAVHRLPGVGHMPQLESRAMLGRILAHHLHDGR
ncbi:acetoin dehydrogenase dihydrolipoyllysine-residue acetyltransferase subunit [Acidisoma cellulosilytica]|uniref:Acetoin dehydrogenase dihydrolipoyllysine-residue acetyltransferase subunit n=1 Tax=Acidisoma cellulosilyticum TaxID=2802395 RepID=A0A963Z210_9PROT|nr:acetoin dehydrogenase dihydrolipoyllysine-residue acetyltransferase subunit [Acidisoma cellulosilyticum]MCB8881392.1 acetoin dehydrogenase dihydrolipoyllysine-residue acetyltransferase subunit [Acidisoma cellulosilyticum]